MSWWGKVLGGAFGYMLGGPLGAVLGAAVGHGLDKGIDRFAAEQALGIGERERVQAAFFTATFSVMGHVAKADGRVSEDEIAMAAAIMDRMELQGEMRRAAIRLFSEGKGAEFPLDAVVDQLRRECRRRETLIRLFLEIQLQAAYADGEIDPAEERILLHVAERLGLSAATFLDLERMIGAERHYQSGGAPSKGGGMALADAYALLGVAPSADAAEVKRAYRRLMNQHHPDKLVSKGLPEEMIKIATQKTQEIQRAYERIKEERGS